MKANRLVLVALFFVTSPLWAGDLKSSASEVQNRMNQIFYWHLAEELNISAEQEKAMVKVLEGSQKARLELIAKRDEALSGLRKKLLGADKSANVTTELAAYESANAAIAKTDQEVFSQLRKVFGDQALARFLIVRDEITERLRNSIRKAPAGQSSR